jgi:hypothetical protein
VPRGGRRGVQLSALHALAAAGLSARVDGKRLVVSPASLLTEELRTLIRDRKVELIAELNAAHQTAEVLIAAINRVCDLRGDDDGNRRDLVAECSQLSTAEQVDLMNYFSGQASLWASAQKGIVP